MADLRKFFTPKDFWDKSLLVCCAVFLTVLIAMNILQLDKQDFVTQLLAIPMVICAFMAICLTGRFLGKNAYLFFKKSFSAQKDRLTSCLYFIAGTLGASLTLIVLWRGFVEAPFWQKVRLSLEYYHPHDYWFWANAIAFFLLYAYLKPKIIE